MTDVSEMNPARDDYPRPVRQPNRAQIREQVVTWLDHERGAYAAIKAEVDGAVTNTIDQYRRLARTEGSMNTLEAVLRLIDGGYR